MSQILFLIHENATGLFEMKSAHNPDASPEKPPKPIKFRHRAAVSMAKPNIEDALEPNSLPKRLRLLAYDFSLAFCLGTNRLHLQRGNDSAARSSKRVSGI